MSEVERRQAAGERGKLVVKINREQLMSWTEEFENEFNNKETKPNRIYKEETNMFTLA